jgi:hypothetical protein
LTENFTEHTAGIWVPLVFYAVGGAYLLAFWGMFDRTAYHLVVLGGLSIIIAVALYLLSRWAYWLGLFTFPLLLTVVALALLGSVNLVGLYPDLPTGLFHASMIVYLVFLVFAFVLLIDKRNALKSDRILDMLGRPLSASASQPESEEPVGA